MSIGEVVLILLVALIVFGPDKLPTLARHIGKLVVQFRGYKQQIMQLWEDHINTEQLQENIQKAKAADLKYLEKKASDNLE